MSGASRGAPERAGCCLRGAARGLAVLALALACGQAWAAGRPLPQLLLQAHCDECHQVDTVRIGPPLVAVAARHRAEGEAAVDVLARKIMLGGAGNWGIVPMVPNERITLEQAREMARWILSLT